MTITSTNHAVIRCGQWEFRESDLDHVTQYRTMTDGGFLLTRNDISKAERQTKKLLDRLSKLQDAFVPTTTDGNIAKTILRANRNQRRHQTGRW